MFKYQEQTIPVTQQPQKFVPKFSQDLIIHISLSW